MCTYWSTVSLFIVLDILTDVIDSQQLAYYTQDSVKLKLGF